MMPMTGDYADDYQDWLAQTAQLIRERRWQALDADHLAAAVEDLGKSERRGVASQLTRLLVHLLKWRFQPIRRSDSWRDPIADARLQIQLAIFIHPGQLRRADNPMTRVEPRGMTGAQQRALLEQGFDHLRAGGAAATAAAADVPAR
jgi:hypothetical protein